MSFWNQLRERGVWRNLVLYIGISWGLIESLDFFASRYHLGDALVDMLLLCLLGLLPLAMWVGWKLGAPDGTPGLRWRDGLVGLVYAVLLAGGLYAGFAGRELGGATVQFASVDDEGASVLRERPRLDLIRAVAVGPFTVSDPASPEWLGIGVAESLMIDLSQHRFLTLSFQWNPEIRAAYLKGEGVIPLGLLARQAKGAGARYFITGKVSGTALATSARIEVHQVEPLKRLYAFEASNEPLFQLVDNASTAIKPHLDLSAERAEGDDDLPVAELLTPSPEALAAFFESDHVLMVKEDYTVALQKAQRASESDPDFAMAAIRVAMLGQTMGSFELAKAGYAKAMANLHRLTPILQCVVRANHAAYANQSERSQRIAKGCVDMFPNDANARSMYAGMLAMNPDTLGAAIEQYEALYALGPANDYALLQLARLKSLTGDETGAIAALASYRLAHPEETATANQMVTLLSRRGEFEAAEEILLDALGRQESVELTAALVNLYLRQGRYADSERALAEHTAKTPDEIMSLAATEAQILSARGRELEALAVFDKTLKLAPTGLLAQYELRRFSQFSGVLLRRDGLAGIDAELSRLIPDNDDLSRASRDIYRSLALIHGQDIAALSAADEMLGQFIVSTKREDVRFLQSLVRARQRDAEGKGVEAAALFAQAHEQMRRSPNRFGVGESLVLRWWLETARHGAQAAELGAPQELAARGFPGSLPLLMARAEAAALTAQIDLARSLLEAGAPLLEQSAADSAAAAVAGRVRELLEAHAD